jgi:hypothetical protein
MKAERALRFGKLISKIELACKDIQNGQAGDVLMHLVGMKMQLVEAIEIAQEVSRNALDEMEL